MSNLNIPVQTTDLSIITSDFTPQFKIWRFLMALKKISITTPNKNVDFSLYIYDTLGYNFESESITAYYEVYPNENRKNTTKCSQLDDFITVAQIISNFEFIDMKNI